MARSKTHPISLPACGVSPDHISRFWATSAFLEGGKWLPKPLFVRGGVLVVVTVTRAERVKMAQTEQHDELAKIAARFAAMPTFPIAVREYTVSLMRLRGSPRPLNRLTSH